MATCPAPCPELRDIDDRFDRYEHMPITPLDVLVFRIMAALQQGKKPIGHGRDSNPWVIEDFSIPWDYLSLYGDSYLRDVQVLRKLLFTNLNGHPLGEIFDLIQRYYFEVDDPAFRLWRQGIWPDMSSVMVFPQPSELVPEPAFCRCSPSSPRRSSMPFFKDA